MIRLKKGKQRELVESVKKKLNLTWKDLGFRLNVSPEYLSLDIRHENVLMKDTLYASLCSALGEGFDEFIEEKLDRNWGQVKGGKLSVHKPRKLKLLVDKPSVNLAEAIGILLGDGSLYHNKKYDVRQVCVTGHLEHDYDYLINYVKPLFEDVFKIEFKHKRARTIKALVVYNQSKDLIYTLNFWGIPTGNKVSNNVSIPRWIFESDEYLKACVRGLLDTDGSVCPITGRNYSYIWFNSCIPALRETFSEAMNKLGFKIAKWSVKRVPQTFIGSKEMILKYANEIGFSNSYHRGRLMLPTPAESKTFKNHILSN